MRAATSRMLTWKSKTPKTLIANVSIEIKDTVDEVWKALVSREIVEKYMLGSQQLSDWQKGTRIVWKKDFNWRKFEGKGEILEIELLRVVPVN